MLNNPMGSPPLSVKTHGRSGRATQEGTAGFPEARENNPSIVATASASLKRIQLTSSAKNALSRICAELPWSTKSTMFEILARSVRISAETPGSRQALSSNRSISFAMGLPSNFVRVHWRTGMASVSAELSRGAGSRSITSWSSSLRGDALSPSAEAARTRFSAAHPRLTKR
jgi:hypothetical protein